MSNVVHAAEPQSVIRSPARAAPILAALMLGIVVVAGAGFVSVEAVHNAAHDQRHAIGFPCH